MSLAAVRGGGPEGQGAGPVLVTGATGFLGTALVRRLLEGGHDVRALVRASSDTGDLDRAGVPWVVGSLDPAVGLDEALVGCGALIHAAGGGRGRSTASIVADNQRSTEALVAACERADVRRFVLVSSLAARGPGRAGAASGPTSVYGRSKAAAERAAQGSGQLCAVIVRPPAVYGPGDTGLLPLFRAVERGFALVPGPSMGAALVYVDDCADAVVRALGPQVTAGTYTLQESVLGARELARAVGVALGRSPRVFGVPGVVLRSAALAGEALGSIRGRPPLLGWDKAGDLLQPWWEGDPSAAIAGLGWRARVPLERGLAQTAAWYRDAGWLRGAQGP